MGWMDREVGEAGEARDGRLVTGSVTLLHYVGNDSGGRHWLTTSQ